jgi:TRAP-type C4-dicarboxylate transport system permease small subunit
MKRFFKKYLFASLLILSLLFFTVAAEAQCSICTKTASQMGEKPARGLNMGILYLALSPFAIVGFIGYRWWKKNK